MDLRLLLGSRLHLNRLARIRADDAAAPPEPLLDALTTEHGYHNGGDLVFGGDGKLYVAIGEVHEAERAQDPDDLGGKILRLNPDGSTPSDDPFGSENPAYSMGHRNSFGLCVDPSTVIAVGDGERAGQRRRGQPDRAGRQLRLARPARPGRRAGVHRSRARLPRRDRADRLRGLEGDLYFGAYGTGALYRLSLPARTDAQADVVGDARRRDHGSPGGPGRGPVRRRLPKRSGNSRERAHPTPQTNAPAADPSGSGWKTAIAVVAGLALVAGLIMRFAAGWRLRRETRGR